MVASPTGNVSRSGLLVTMKGHRKLFHAPMNTKMETAIRIGRDSGITMVKNTRSPPAPSILAASSNSLGMVSKKFLRINTIMGATTCGRTMPAHVSASCMEFICWYKGTMRIWPGTMMEATVMAKSHFRPLNSMRENP
jgi:hypothetical protein